MCLFSNNIHSVSRYSSKLMSSKNAKPLNSILKSNNINLYHIRTFPHPYEAAHIRCAVWKRFYYLSFFSILFISQIWLPYFFFAIPHAFYRQLAYRFRHDIIVPQHYSTLRPFIIISWMWFKTFFFKKLSWTIRKKTVILSLMSNGH